MNGIVRTNRRNFVKAGGLTALAAATAQLGEFSGVAAEGKKSSKAITHEFCTFTKPLQHMSYDEVSEAMTTLGYDGVESAVRPGGHIEPEKVEDDLPKMMASLKKKELNLTVMTTSINEVSKEQRTEAILKTAAAQGVKRFRMGYYKYDLSKPVHPQLAEFRPKLKDLVALCSELGIKPIYQNHSGKNYFGGPIWDLAEVFEDFDPKQLGVAYDIGHATVEGAKSWPLDFARIKEYIDTVYVKEPRWENNKLAWGALGSGSVDKGFYTTLKRSGFTGPISVHVEYLGHKDPKIMPEVITAMGENFATLKQFLKDA